MKNLFKTVFAVTILLLIGCSNDSESDLIESIEEETGEETIVSYNATIRTIINNNCTGCHSDPTQNGAPFPLTNYSQVLTRAENGQLLRSISRQTGEARAMPPSGRLAQNTIDIIERWIQEGAIEQ